MTRKKQTQRKHYYGQGGRSVDDAIKGVDDILRNSIVTPQTTIPQTQQQHQQRIEPHPQTIAPETTLTPQHHDTQVPQQFTQPPINIDNRHSFTFPTAPQNVNGQITRRGWIIGGLVAIVAAAAGATIYGIGSMGKKDGVDVDVDVNVDGKSMQPPSQSQQPQYRPQGGQNLDGGLFEGEYGLYSGRGLADWYKDLEFCAGNRKRFKAKIVVSTTGYAFGDWNRSRCDVKENSNQEVLYSLIAGYDPYKFVPGKPQGEFFVDKYFSNGSSIRLYGPDFERDFDRGGWGNWLTVEFRH